MQPNLVIFSTYLQRFFLFISVVFWFYSRRISLCLSLVFLSIIEYSRSLWNAWNSNSQSETCDIIILALICVMGNSYHLLFKWEWVFVFRNLILLKYTMNGEQSPESYKNIFCLPCFIHLKRNTNIFPPNEYFPF